MGAGGSEADVNCRRAGGQPSAGAGKQVRCLDGISTVGGPGNPSGGVSGPQRRQTKRAQNTAARGASLERGFPQGEMVGESGL